MKKKKAAVKKAPVVQKTHKNFNNTEDIFRFWVGMGLSISENVGLGYEFDLNDFDMENDDLIFFGETEEEVVSKINSWEGEPSDKYVVCIAEMNADNILSMMSGIVANVCGIHSVFSVIKIVKWFKTKPARGFSLVECNSDDFENDDE